MSANTQIIILAAGQGSRTGQKALPKVLIPLKGKPIIEYLLTEVKQLESTRRPVIVVGYKHTEVRKALGSNFRYAIQKQQLGTAHAVWSAQSEIDAPNVLVLYGDMPFISAASLKKLIDLHTSQQAVLSMFTSFVPNFNGLYRNYLHFGRIIRNQFNAIAKIVEYADASAAERKIREINSGIYMFNTPWLWNSINQITDQNTQGEFYLTDTIELAIAEDHAIHSLAINPTEIFGINTPEQLAQANRLMQKRL